MSRGTVYLGEFTEKRAFDEENEQACEKSLTWDKIFMVVSEAILKILSGGNYTNEMLELAIKNAVAL
jgi:hypothetical protein